MHMPTTNRLIMLLLHQVCELRYNIRNGCTATGSHFDIWLEVNPSLVGRGGASKISLARKLGNKGFPPKHMYRARCIAITYSLALEECLVWRRDVSTSTGRTAPVSSFFGRTGLCTVTSSRPFSARRPEKLRYITISKIILESFNKCVTVMWVHIILCWASWTVNVWVLEMVILRVFFW